MRNITNIPAPRVEIIDPRTGLMSREWYRFFLNLFMLTGGGSNDTTITDTLLGPPPGADLSDVNQQIAGIAAQPAANAFNDEINKQINALASSPGSNAILAQIAQIEKDLNGLKMQIQPQLGTMAALQQANLPWVTFDTTPQSVPTDVGTVVWDGGTTLGIQMTPNVLQPVGEAQYFYIKADSTITKGQLIMFTGAVGASGVIRGAPATGLTDGQYLIGLAAENIATNGFGLVTSFGHVRGWNTTGAPVGETWADGDILYYNPSIPGGLTKTQPSAPNIKATIAAVINAAPAGSGDVFVRVSTGSVLGGTDSNVQFGTLATNDLIQYNGTYWTNVTPASILAGAGGAPITKTGDFTVAAGETWIINNKSGSTCTVTLPAAASNTGRVLTFQNYQAQLLVSASSNVVPLGGGAAGTAILDAAVGNWATMVSNGTNWVVMQDAPNNALLTE